MDRQFELLVDTGSEIDNILREEKNIGILCTGVSISGKDFLSYPEWAGISKEEFFSNLKENRISIYQPAVYLWKDEIEKIFEKGKDVLFIGMSARFAGGIKNLNIAQKLLKVEYPNRRLEIIDSGLVGAGYKCLVCAIVDMLDYNNTDNLNDAVDIIHTLFLGHAYSFWILEQLDSYIRANRGADKNINNVEGKLVIASKDNNYHIAYIAKSKEEAFDFLVKKAKSTGKIKNWELAYSPDWNSSDISAIADMYTEAFKIPCSHKITYQSPTVTAVAGPYSYSIGILR